MKFYEMQIEGLTRRLPICSLTDDLSIAGFVLFGDTEITEVCAKRLLELAPDFDVIVTAEAKGIPLAYEMSKQCGKKYVILRKKPKLYMVDVIQTDVESITTAHVQSLCIGSLEAEDIRNKRVLVVDDVISTGGSLAAIEAILSQIEGCTIVDKMCILAEGAALKRDDITYLEELPLFTPDGEPIE